MQECQDEIWEPFQAVITFLPPRCLIAAIKASLKEPLMSGEWDAWWNAGNLQGRRWGVISQSCQRWRELSRQNRPFTTYCRYFSAAAGNLPRLHIQAGKKAQCCGDVTCVCLSELYLKKFMFLRINNVFLGARVALISKSLNLREVFLKF